ncbi:MAG: hypothetical protein SGJ24_02590 [Chloroflexota bacterium]|nr:hypothetical protein [Chloroflexota bacterium]
MMFVLSDEERDLLQDFADEHGIDDVRLAVGILLREYIQVMDALWEIKLAQPNTTLDALIAQVDRDAQADQIVLARGAAPL